MKELFGKFEYENNNYGFAYKDYIITIISAGYEYATELCDKVCDDVLIGLTKENKWIIFFGCKFHNSSIIKLATHITTQGYIILDSPERPDLNNLFNQITFYSPAINDFYPPQLAVKSKDNNSDKSDFSIEFKDKDECVREIVFKDYVMKLGFYFINKYNSQSNDLLNCQPCISFVFDRMIGINELKDCCLRIISFLAFINFNNNIPIEKIQVIKNENGHMVNSGIGYINSSHSVFDSRKHKSILANFFDDSELVSLFNQVSDYEDIKKHYYIPETVKGIHRFNHSDLLLCATCFEGLFKQYHPDFKATENAHFKTVKDKFLEFANDYAQSDGLSKQERKYIKKFTDLISRYDGLLEEIFNFSLSEHKFELNDFIERLKIQIKPSTENYGSMYADIRNHFAHGDFFDLGNDERFIYELLHGLIYAINLREAAIPSEKAKEIINKILL